MPRVLTNLRIDEVSSVDRGAGEGVKIMLMKREGTEPMSKIGSMFAKVFGGNENNNDIVIDKSIQGLAESVATIVTEATSTDELSSSLAKTFEQFGDHLKDTLTAGTAVVKVEGSNMDLKVLAKALGLPETATEVEVSEAIVKQQKDNAAAILKMAKELSISKADFSADELAFYTKASGDDNGDEVADATNAKKSFRLASKSARETIMKSAEPALPAYIQKMMDDNAVMKAELATLKGSTALVDLAKAAKDAGLPETEAVTLQKAYAGDKAAIDKLLDFVKQAAAVATAGGVFKEFGATNGTGIPANAYEELVAKAAELRKTDPKLSVSQAFSKVYEDPNNADLVKRERAENRPTAA